MGEEDVSDTIMREISRIQKSPRGSFKIEELKKRHKINQLNINLKEELKTLKNAGYIYETGNNVYRLTPDGKKREHELELKYISDGVRRERNRYKM